MTKVKWEDTVYEFDYSEIDSDSALEIESKLGLGVIDLMVGLEKGSIKALQAVFWYMKNSNGEAIEIEDCKFKPMLFLAALNDGAQADIDEQQKVAEEAEAARSSALVAAAKKARKKTVEEVDPL